MQKYEKGIKRYGARYGRTVKHRMGAIEALHRGKHLCPNCRYTQATRRSAGIWYCSKCKKTFASRAYELTPAPAVRSDESKEV
jgi:large subunit ribosomal protein L37Ae